MDENITNTGDANMEVDSEMDFDNLTILKELSNIANLIGDEEFLETVPKAKHKRVKWVPMFNCLKQGIFNEMVQEVGAMWRGEDMPRKLAVLDKQKERFADKNIDTPLWRPALGDVKSQLRAIEAGGLHKQRAALQALAAEYEARVNRMKKVISAKRGYLKALQMDMQKYQKKNEDIQSHITDRFANIKNILTPPAVNLEKQFNTHDIPDDCYLKLR